MEEIKFNLSDDEIRQIVFSAFNEEKFWIQKIERQRPNELKGTFVIVKSLDENSEESYEIKFSFERLETKGVDKSRIRKLYQTYYKTVSKNVQEYKTEFKDSLDAINQFIIATKMSLKSQLFDYLFEEAGFVSSKLIKEKIKAYTLTGNIPEQLRFGKHMTYVRLNENDYYSSDREINVGSVYYADLDPVVGAEYGGFRPVIIIGYSNDKKNYLCIPLSSKKNQGEYVGSFGEKDRSYAVTSRRKIVDPMRLYAYLGDLQPEVYAKIVEESENSYTIVANMEAQTGSSLPEVEMPIIKTSSAEIEDEEELDDEIDSDQDLEILGEEIEETPIQNSDESITVSAKTELQEDGVDERRVQFELMWDDSDDLRIKGISSKLVYPTEEEYMKIVSERVVALKKLKGMRFIATKKNDFKLDYQIYGEDGHTTVKLNPNHNDPSKHYYPVRFNFGQVQVKWTSYSSHDTEVDEIATNEFQKIMMSKNPDYHLLVLYNLARLFYATYKAKTVDESDRDVKDGILNHETKKLEYILTKLGIIYKGELYKVVKYGYKGLNLSAVEKVVDPSNEEEIEKE